MKIYPDLNRIMKAYRKPKEHTPQWIYALCALACALAILAWCPMAHADININKLADSIYIAEGGSQTRHPYGILQHYEHTTPRQACINTIKHAYTDWVGLGYQGDFIAFLGNRYCPIGSNTDDGTCAYWVKNVKYYYNK